ncbi:MAG TPA: metalloregulator ArsR/SmtB family transcription factor [Kutzneria sp.]|nr:metalloregulator ArsR/SmtB family transcription factor [Kutzneria sp.]
MPPVSPDAATPVPERPAGHAGGVTALADAHEHAPRELGANSAPRRTAGTLTAAGDLLRALAAPVRIAIVLQLQEGERCVHELVDALAVAQPLISQHLRVLKSAGVVHGERHGREVMYRLVDEHLAHIVVDAVTHVEEGGSAARGEQREEA